MWRALALGCIPVTFFRAAELPFTRRLGLDYSQFVVNVQPDDYRRLQACCSASLLRQRMGYSVGGTTMSPLAPSAARKAQHCHGMHAITLGCDACSFLALLGQWQGL